MNSVTNDTTRIRRLPPEYFVDTQRMPKIDLAALLVTCGAVEVQVFDALSRRIGYGVPRYRPPHFARLYAWARFNYPRVFASLRVAVLLLWLCRDVEVISTGSDSRDGRFIPESPHVQRRPLKPIMFCTTDSDSSAI